MKLRYIGTELRTLPVLGLEVEPGTELDLADIVGAGFAARPDFERLDAPAQAEPPAEAEGAAPPTEAGKRKTKAATSAAETQSTDEPAATA